jgi:DmsE family decaheme c-type cytochrome
MRPAADVFRGATLRGSSGMRTRPLVLALVLALVLGAALLAAASLARAEEAGYAGDAACLDCHADLADPYAKTIHARVLNEKVARVPAHANGCEACHGPGLAHVEAGGGKGSGALLSFRAESAEAIERENDACLGCHAKAGRLHWSGSVHESRDVACTSCHVVMKNLSEQHQLARRSEGELCASCHLIQRAQMHRNAHMPVREGAMSCSSCHQPHGSVSPALMRQDTVNDNCYSCHAEKRGPFLWEHAPVNESCLNCHEPHGSTRPGMLKLSQPRLCQQCHVASRHPSEARLPQNRFVIGQGCLNCHSNIHGSNHPSGHAFTR